MACFLTKREFCDIVILSLKGQGMFYQLRSFGVWYHNQSPFFSTGVIMSRKSASLSTPKVIRRPRRGSVVYLVGYGLTVAVVCILNAGGQWKFEGPGGMRINMPAGAVELHKA